MLLSNALLGRALENYVSKMSRSLRLRNRSKSRVTRSRKLFAETLESRRLLTGDFEWAKGLSGVGNEAGNDIAVDASGNVYTTGHFDSTVDFNPGAGIFNLTSFGNDDAYISKVDSAGNFVWAKKIGGSSFDTGWRIALDVDGNVYISGTFEGTADFDPGAAVYQLTSAGSWDMFVLKLDVAGNFVWAKKMGSTDNDEAYAITVDQSSNVYLTGYFNGTVDFDPSAGVSNLTTAGSYDIFVSKLDSAGNFVWAKSLGGTSAELGNDIAVDAIGNVYTTGFYFGTVDFAPGASVYSLTSMGERDVFVSALDSSGDFVWADRKSVV